MLMTINDDDLMSAGSNNQTSATPGGDNISVNNPFDEPVSGTGGSGAPNATSAGLVNSAGSGSGPPPIAGSTQPSLPTARQPYPPGGPYPPPPPPPVSRAPGIEQSQLSLVSSVFSVV